MKNEPRSKEIGITKYFSAKSVIAGTSAGILTDSIFYALDSYKVQSQAKIFNMSRLFRGLVPMLIMGSAPSYGAFFLLYQPTKNLCDELQGENDKNQAISVLSASILASIPSSLVFVPADVIKKRLMLDDNLLSPNKSSSSSISPTVSSVIKSVYSKNGPLGFFAGWQANLIKDIAFGGFKMSLYEATARAFLKFKYTDSRRLAGAESLNSTEAAVVGFIAGCMTSVLTMPLDTVNTRIKSGELESLGIYKGHLYIARKDGPTALFRGLLPRTILIGVGSTVFWFINAKVMEIL